MDHSGAKLLPFYLVVDVSISMSGRKLDSANRMLPSIVDALAKNPILSDKVRFGIIDFSDDAQVRLPLCDLLDPTVQLPGLFDPGRHLVRCGLPHAEERDRDQRRSAQGGPVHGPPPDRLVHQ